LALAHWCDTCRGPGNPGTHPLAKQGAIPDTLGNRIDLTPESMAVFVRNGISIMLFFRRTEINDAGWHRRLHGDRT
jgi:(+)-pinoresinol hydroxylase